MLTRVKKNNLIPYLFLLVLLLFGFRYNYASDFQSYWSLFSLRVSDLSGVWRIKEPILLLVLYAKEFLGLNSQVGFLCFAILIVFFLEKLRRVLNSKFPKSLGNYFLYCYIFYSFFYLQNSIRQPLAAVIVLYVILLLDKKVSFVGITIAMSSHFSALFALGVAFFHKRFVVIFVYLCVIISAFYFSYYAQHLQLFERKLFDYKIPDNPVIDLIFIFGILVSSIILVTRFKKIQPIIYFGAILFVVFKFFPGEFSNRITVMFRPFFVLAILIVPLGYLTSNSQAFYLRCMCVLFFMYFVISGYFLSFDDTYAELNVNLCLRNAPCPVKIYP